MKQKDNVKPINDIELIKKQWKLMTKKYFELLEREKNKRKSICETDITIDKTSCPSG